MILEENYSLKSDLRKVNEDNIEMKAEIKGMNIALNYIKEFNEKQSLASSNLASENNVQTSSEKMINIQNHSSQAQEDQRYQGQENYSSQEVNPIIVSNPVSIPKEKKVIKDPYEALLAFKAKANKREMLKQKMTSMVSDSGMNLSELKFMFVEHYKYCSKATFYNYLKELEIEKIIKIERENTKNIVYINRVENHL